MDQARADRRAGLRGPLAGQPVLLKDNIEAAGPLPTTAGSLALAEQRHQPRCAAGRAAARGGRGDPRQDQSQRMGQHPLRTIRSRAGARSAARRATRRRSTATRAAARAAAARRSPPGLVRLAIGTETDGSVTCPAAINGIVGLKPTVGLVSRTHIVPISHSQDTAGPMAASVREAADAADRDRRKRPRRSGDARRPTSARPTMPPRSTPIRSRASGSG